jgi:hypothetical protein
LGAPHGLVLDGGHLLEQGLVRPLLQQVTAVEDDDPVRAVLDRLGNDLP